MVVLYGIVYFIPYLSGGQVYGTIRAVVIPYLLLMYRVVDNRVDPAASCVII